MTADPGVIFANLVNQRQAANYGSLVDLLVSKGIVTLNEVRRARLRAEAAVDQVSADDLSHLQETEFGQMFADLLGKGEEDDE
jgi:hypothetical protein